MKTLNFDEWKNKELQHNNIFGGRYYHKKGFWITEFELLESYRFYRNEV
jgi:hypothetical protein